MKNFTSVKEINNVGNFLEKAIKLKTNISEVAKLGVGKTLGLIFLNPSLRTRLSSQKAALNLGMQVFTMNAGQEAWAWELDDNAIMNGNTVEHIIDAAKVISNYCDVVGLRCFPELKNREKDYADEVINKFIQNCNVPVISLESATRHPLQSFADLITIKENMQQNKQSKIKIALTWAPHVKPLPQAVANSFSEWVLAWKNEPNTNIEFCITQPHGYELSEEFTQGADIFYNQDSLQDADYIYVKNWSSFAEYGSMPKVDGDWMLDKNFIKTINPDAKIMHCMPVRRNLELGSDLIDSENSLLYKQANNRTFAMQTVLQSILENSK